MKKKIIMLLAVVMTAVLGYAEDFTVNGIKYTGDENTKTATVTGTEDGFNQTDVVIPEVVNGYTVMKIGDDAFNWNLNLKTVELPNTVKTIASWAFAEALNLESVKMPNMLDSIGHQAFQECEKLKEISIPSSVRFIGLSAFVGCKSIDTIVIPEGIETIKEDCYAGCEALKTVTLPSTLKTIERMAFEGCRSLTSIELPETVETLGYGCFERSGLTSVHIPASVKKIESIQDTHWPFRACFQLTKITIAEDNPVYDSRNGCNAIIETATNKLIEGCAGTVIPENVVTIGASAFELCPFKTIEIPNSVTNIEKFAFLGCTKLENINLPDNITVIAEGTFISCDSLRSVKLPKNLKSIENDAFYECEALESIEFPAGLTKIGDHAFHECEKMTSLLIPASVSEIGKDAFWLCDGLTTIKVEQGNTVYDSREDCNAIIKTADNEMVLGCQTTFIPQSVTSIGDNAFQGFAAITEMTLPDGLTHIGRSAFANTTITSITLPASLTSIGSSAFNGSFLKTVISYIQEPFEIEGSTFSGMNGQTLYVPKGCTNKYKATEGWNWFEFIREIGDTGEGYLWTGDYERGGKAKATDNVSVGYANAGYTTIRLNGKPKWYDGDYITVDLEKPLHTGDKISVTAYRNKNAANKKSGVRMELWGEEISGTVTVASSTGLEFVNIDQSDDSAGDNNRGTEPNTCVFEVPAKANGCTGFYMTRSHAETNLFITEIRIGDTIIQGDVNGDGSVNVGDIMAVINVMAGQGGDMTLEQADVNGDGSVNVGDIMAIINLMAQ